MLNLVDLDNESIVDGLLARSGLTLEADAILGERVAAELSLLITTLLAVNGLDLMI